MLRIFVSIIGFWSWLQTFFTLLIILPALYMACVPLCFLFTASWTDITILQFSCIPRRRAHRPRSLPVTQNRANSRRLGSQRIIDNLRRSRYFVQVYLLFSFWGRQLSPRPLVFKVDYITLDRMLFTHFLNSYAYLLLVVSIYYIHSRHIYTRV